MFAEYDNGGDLVWSNNFAQPCLAMVVDSSANRFMSFAHGTVARLGTDGSAPNAFLITPANSPASGPKLSLQSKPLQAWQIQTSTNLSTWSTLFTITNASGAFQFNDPSLRTARIRFYRAVPLP